MSDLALDFVAPYGPQATINFFYQHLRDETGTAEGETLSGDEVVHVASVLAHFALTSNASETDPPPCRDLADIHQLATDPALCTDGELMELAAGQVLLLVGFFREQIRRQSNANLSWYDHLGGRFYAFAGRYGTGERHNRLMRRMSRHFPLWIMYCRNLNETLRNNPYLIRSLPGRN